MSNPLSLESRLLLRFCRKPGSADYAMKGVRYDAGEELEELSEVFPNITAEVAGKVVVDYGCGFGHQSVALSEYAQQVYGIDISERALEEARSLAAERYVAHNTTFATQIPDGVKADVIISRNSFEHFMQPDETLAEMAGMLTPQGRIYITFAPPWCAPWGAHMGFFCRLPWVQLIFSEGAIMQARSLFRTDGAKTFADTGLAQMSISKFEHVVARSGLKFVWKRYDCIKRIDWLAATPMRELAINRVNCIVER